MLSSAEGQFGHPHREQVEAEGVHAHVGGGSGEEGERRQQGGQFTLVAFQALTARIQRRFRHGDVVDLGGPVGEITRIVRFDGARFEGGDQPQKNGGQFAGGGNRDVVHLHRIVVTEADHLRLAAVELDLAVVDLLAGVPDRAAQVERPQRQVDSARQFHLLFGLDLV